MKDSKGHGSDRRGSGNPESSFTPWPKGTRFVKGTLATADELRASGLSVNKSDTYAAGKGVSDKQAASALAAPGHPKSTPVPIHSGASGRRSTGFHAKYQLLAAAHR